MGWQQWVQRYMDTWHSRATCDITTGSSSRRCDFWLRGWTADYDVLVMAYIVMAYIVLAQGWTADYDVLVMAYQSQ